MEEGIPKQVSRIINENRFISFMAHGLTMGLWNR
jgi:hypothetical protein